MQAVNSYALIGLDNRRFILVYPLKISNVSTCRLQRSPTTTIEQTHLICCTGKKSKPDVTHLNYISKDLFLTAIVTADRQTSPWGVILTHSFSIFSRMRGECVHPVQGWQKTEQNARKTGRDRWALDFFLIRLDITAFELTASVLRDHICLVYGFSACALVHVPAVQVAAVPTTGAVTRSPLAGSTQSLIDARPVDPGLECVRVSDNPDDRLCLPSSLR